MPKQQEQLNFADLGILGAISHVGSRDGSVLRKRGIGGCHNYDEWKKLKSMPIEWSIPTDKLPTDNEIPDVLIISETPHSSIPGVLVIEYHIPSLDQAGLTDGKTKKIHTPKTVYDPAIWTENALIQALKEALQDAANKNSGVIPTQWEGITADNYRMIGFMRGGNVATFYFG